MLLVIVDAALIGINLTHGFFGRPVGTTFDLGADRSYGEFFEYVKTLWVVVMLLVVYWKQRDAVLTVWAAVFTWYGADNAFMLHERAGAWLALNTGIQRAGLYGQHVGEAVYLVLVCLVALGGLILAYRFAHDLGRALSVRLLVLTGMIVVFGIGVDAVHATATEAGAGTTVDVLLTTLEDGGELVAMTGVTAVLFAVSTGAWSPVRSHARDTGDDRTPTLGD